MQCEQASDLLRRNHGKRDQDYDDALFEHLGRCPDCWASAQSLWQEEVAATGYRDPSPATVSAALGRAWHTRHGAAPERRFAVPAAAAAVLVLACALIFPPWGRDTPVAPTGEDATIALAPGAVRQVELLLTSAREHQQAAITVELDDNLSLSGYPGRKRIHWLTSLNAGANQLTLPLQLQNEGDGVITVSVESEGASKRTVFTVRPTPARPSTPQVI